MLIMLIYLKNINESFNEWPHCFFCSDISLQIHLTITSALLHTLFLFIPTYMVVTISSAPAEGGLSLRPAAASWPAQQPTSASQRLAFSCLS
jgi:hypothetical protein